MAAPRGSADGLTRHLESWQLRRDGPEIHGTTSRVLPVRTADGMAAILKLDPRADPGEHLVLRRWGGHGAVRLLRADPACGAVLLERLGPAALDALDVADACAVVAELYGRLHVAALPRLPSLTAQVRQWVQRLEALPRSAPVPRRLVEQAIALGRELTAAATEPEVVLHGDLHFGNVLTADRAPWLAIAPRPVNGDPHFEPAPVLLHRWDDLDGHVRDGVRHRFFTLVAAAGIDEDRARAATIVRVVQHAVRALDGGARRRDRDQMCGDRQGGAGLSAAALR